MLLKVCLLLGVKVYPGVTFTGLVEPKNANSGWSVTTSPTSCPVSSSSRNYDIILGADGKQNSLPGFRTKEFRAKLALAITVNFVNHNTKQESSVPEISGVAYVYRQEFFNSMAKELGIALENIVYYKDETHYFVMTAKKTSLLNRGVLKKVKFQKDTLSLSLSLSLFLLHTHYTETLTCSFKHIHHTVVSVPTSFLMHQVMTVAILQCFVVIGVKCR